MKLKRKKGYTRTITALYRVMRRLNIKFYKGMNVKNTSKKKHNQHYETPKKIGEKGQMDVKYVPNECKRKEIQTDNGIEFTYNKSNIKKVHPLDELLKKLGIKHHKIQPRTPQHNGKVERSHRNDNERFYSYLKFYSLEDLREQGKRYLKRSNNIPMAVLKYLTPKEKKQNWKQLE